MLKQKLITILFLCLLITKTLQNSVEDEVNKILNKEESSEEKIFKVEYEDDKENGNLRTPEPFPDHVEDMLRELENINLDDFDLEKLEEEMRMFGEEL